MIAAQQPYAMLEWVFIGALVIMTLAVGWMSLVVIARTVEPRGVRVLLRRLAGRD